MSIEETLKRIREKKGAAPPPPPAPAPAEPAPSDDIYDDPLVKEAMEIFGAEVEGWGDTPPTPEGWENIHPGVKQ